MWHRTSDLLVRERDCPCSTLTMARIRTTVSFPLLQGGRHSPPTKVLRDNPPPKSGGFDVPAAVAAVCDVGTLPPLNLDLNTPFSRLC